MSDPSVLKPLRSPQRVALQALLMGKTEAQAAALAGCTVVCLRRWRYRQNWTAAMAQERADYGLSDLDLTRRVRRNLLIEANPAVDRIKVIANKATSEKVKFQSNAYLVDKALRDDRVPLAPGLSTEAMVALAKGLAEAFLTHRTPTTIEVCPPVGESEPDGISG